MAVMGKEILAICSVILRFSLHFTHFIVTFSFFVCGHHFQLWFSADILVLKFTSAPQEFAQVLIFKGMSSYQGPLCSLCTITWLYWLQGNTTWRSTSAGEGMLVKIASKKQKKPLLLFSCKNINLYFLSTFSVCGRPFGTAADQISGFATVLPTGCCLWWLSSLWIS